MRKISTRQFHFAILILLINIAATLLYTSIENPNFNTFSMIGSRYDDINNIYFIVWAIMMSITLYYLLQGIIRHYESEPSKKIKLLLHNSILLVLITIIPARLEFALLRWIHIVLSGIYALILTYLIHPYVRKTYKNIMLRIPILVWLLFIWCGSIGIYISYGHNSIYQIWFFINLPIFLGSMYLHLMIAKNKEEDDSKQFWTFKSQSIHIVMLLIANIIVTLIYGNIENPNVYTMSMIGSLLNPIYYLLFLVWALAYSLSTYVVMLYLFCENNCNNVKRMRIVLFSVIILLITVLVPANPEYKILHGIHIGLSVIYLIVFTAGLHFLIYKITEGYMKMKILYTLWLIIAWPGSLILFYLYGNTGIYEIWFFVNVPLILISLVLFTNYKQSHPITIVEEQIIL